MAEPWGLCFFLLFRSSVSSSLFFSFLFSSHLFMFFPCFLGTFSGFLVWTSVALGPSWIPRNIWRQQLFLDFNAFLTSAAWTQPFALWSSPWFSLTVSFALFPFLRNNRGVLLLFVFGFAVSATYITINCCPKLPFSFRLTPGTVLQSALGIY